MRTLALSGVLATLAIMSTMPAAAQHDPTVVTTRAGQVQGSASDGVLSFKGIPYAQPPVGDLRWRAPQPVEPWTGVRQATAFGHDCMQQLGDFEVLSTTPAEDCLYLNVWAPGYADPGDDLPVLVWIHGGGYVGGGSSSPIYDGTAFAKQGIVVVSLNYRLGRLGFFAHPALLAANDGPVGNYGYQDQISALQWVRDNIAQFGGDPGRVTVAGESAGGGSVIALITSPVTHGLFQQAVVMSGGGRQPLITRQLTGGTPTALSADQIDAEFAASLGVTGSDAAALSALRAMPADRFSDGLDLAAVLQQGLACVAAEVKDPAGYDPACRPALSGTPVIDGTIVTDTPEAILTGPDAPHLPILIGTTASDLPESFPPSVLDPWSWFGDDAKAAQKHYRLPFLARAALLLKGQGQLKDLLPVVSLSSDMTMHEPARFVARRMTANGDPAWLYRFTYTAQSTRPDAKRQTHAGELPFLFDTLDAKYGDATTDQDRRMAEAFETYVSDFVKTGDPNGAGLPRWPRFDPDAFDLMDLSLDDGPVYGRDDRADGIRLVERVANRRLP